MSPRRALSLLSLALLAPASAFGQEAPAAAPCAVAAPAAPEAGCVPAPAAPPAPVFGGELCERLKLTGDWGGCRDEAAAKGITFDFSLTQFYQGVTQGGRERAFEYGGKLDYFINVDGEKAGLWKGFFVQMHAETRYGQDLAGIAGTLSPTNTAMLFPTRDDITAITGLKLTQALSENFVVFGGKINTIDGYMLNFAGGRGVDAFMNTAFCFPMNELRAVPYSSLGGGFAILEEGQPVFSFLAMDAVDHPTTSGLDEPFEKGVTMLAELRIPVKPFGLPGHQIFDAVYSTRSYTLLERSAFAIVPGQGLTSSAQTGTWAFNYSFDQYLWVDACDPKVGWGVFFQSGIADEKTCLIAWTLSVGLGGSGLVPGRPADSFGLGYFHLGLSDDFKGLFAGPVLAPRLGQQDEHGVELFYNFAATPWCHVTADLQVVEPSTRSVERTVILGLRAKVDF